jgi:hypothetical protein
VILHVNIRAHHSLTIGVDVDVKHVEIREVKGLSVFDAARSEATTYREAVLEGRVLSNIRLEHYHRYEFETLTNELMEKLGLELITSKVRGSASILLGKKLI